ncbi:MAG: hypothetical protein V1765_02760 [bacterium]
MSRQNWEELEKTLAKKYIQRDRKKRPTMKVSGAGVKQLQKIIKNK